MTQLEQELSALFEDAASRVTIRPLPVRSPRSVAINRVLAAGVTTALVAAVALIATRLGSDSANRGGAITPTATQQLLDAVARTLGQPIRLETTIDSGQGATHTSITEMDFDRQQLVAYQDGQPQFLITGGRVYEGISSTDRQLFHFPASAEWTQGPRSGPAVGSMMQSVDGGLLGVQHIADGLNSGRFTVSEVAPHTFRFRGNQSAPRGDTVLARETLHVSADGLIDWAKVQADFSTGPGGPEMHFLETARITPLGHAIAVTAPDPKTVISQKAYEAATNSGQSCPGGPSPAPSSSSNGSVYSSTIHCFSSTATLRPVKQH